MVGTTTRALRFRRWIAVAATSVLPDPVGRITMPRPPERSHASTASRW
jgi:hypothetical protein